MKNKTTVGERILFITLAMFVNSGVFVLFSISFSLIPNTTFIITIFVPLFITITFAKLTYDIWNCENKNTENENRIIDLEKKIEELINNK